MKPNPLSYRTSLAVFLTCLIIFEMVAYAVTTPRPQERFFEFYILGASRTAQDYYPRPNSFFIQFDESVNWYIGVRNAMGSLQFVDVRVKLGNLTISAPNDTTASPSPAPLVTEFKHFISVGESWEIPFSWNVHDFTRMEGGYSNVQLTIANASYSVKNAPGCSRASSCRFRLIFELWTWNIDSRGFEVGWWNGDRHRIAWLQLWFDVTPRAQ